ncbi:DsrE family protein [Leptospira sp. FAT2]|uniref:DsrE family protein n=1 Tax=Leptospira sanjuanensis TaxID=2879643 RepID=UPI001EE82657|nr:DsrE family protein [Leptospira sanjuanensis]MCG6192350.1 DsrE family protein [Leptospira sanjuanensis]
MKLGIVIYSVEPETVYNAFRIGNHALKKGDSVRIFLLGAGVEVVKLKSEKFKVEEQIDSFRVGNGEILACGTCLDLRETNGGESCRYSNLADLYEIIESSDKILSF